MRRILTFRLIPLRRSTTTLLLCVVNMLWSYAGGWSFTLGALSEYRGAHLVSHAWIGIDSSRGCLTIAERDGQRYRWSIYPQNEPLRPNHAFRGWSFKPRFELPRELPSPWMQPNPFAWPPNNSPHVYESRVWRVALEPYKRGYYIARKATVQWWVLCIVAAVMPAIRIILWIIRYERFPAGFCPACGYDLRATPDRCPECGTAPSAPPHGIRQQTG